MTSPLKNAEGVAKLPQHESSFVTAFILATVDTLSLQCQTKVSAGEAISKETHEEKRGEVIVIGGIVGKGIDCSVAFCFPEVTCCHLVGSMLQRKVTLGADQVMAAAAELVRMVGFQAKKLLNDRGYKVEAIFPRIVVEGRTVQIWADKMRDGIVVPFETPRRDRFYIEIL